ncbi:acyl-CoA--6-aminopenicillanic acid acyltransferase [Bordetella genomosp. 7]|uniref:C45 family autoproteolytic acyltransferase/hydolase n=1 Tax=Bordetella genomosp. 7 TaxID=1416805 RepID=UPI000B9E056A|nr:C45 family peptidase [Bordetella genomosp. 7]OZI15699.1 acyl-CoA--6-aminopenicillanic acid acyltransferase [Bordetella genomosp. 7]
MQTPFPFVSISGAPFERGRQYGAAVPERIAHSARYYRGELDKIGTDPAGQAALIAEFAAQIEAFRPEHGEEMRGIAAGSGVSFDDVVLINARTEVIAKARLLGRQAAIDPAEGECTAAIVMPERSADGRMIHAHNWDWDPDARDSTIVLRVQGEDGLSVVTLVEAGGLARHGLNSAGLALTGNYISCDRDYTQSGVPLSSIRRAALEQRHVAVAMQLLAATPKACSSNMIVSQDGWLMDFECVPDESFTLLPQNGLLTHSNHFISEVALGKVREAGLRNAVDTYYRAWRVRELLDACGPRISVADVRRALADDWATPYSVCRPPRGTLTGGRTATVATIIIDPVGLTMDIAAMPSFGQSFTRYTFEGEPQPVD